MFIYSVLFLLFGAFSVRCNVTSVCTLKVQTVVSGSYLDTAEDMISKAKTYMPDCKPELKTTNCADVMHIGHKKSGVYEIWPASRLTQKKSIYVYCDMDTDGGGWTIIQRRGDFQRSKDSFFQDWQSYKEGFGELDKDFWLGNDNIFALTTQKLYSVRFDLKAVDQKRRYAHYDKFWIDDEINNYTLHVSRYTGDAGDSLAVHNNQKFSTKDQDKDNDEKIHCAQQFKGGWWYNACLDSNLNGLYHKGEHESEGDGVIWMSWKGSYESLEWTEIKIRPKSFNRFYVPKVFSKRKNEKEFSVPQKGMAVKLSWKESLVFVLFACFMALYTSSQETYKI